MSPTARHRPSIVTPQLFPVPPSQQLPCASASLHLEEWQVHKLANCRKGTWRASQMLSVALTKKILDKLGYPSMYDQYLKVCENL